ncbi:MAG: helix-hairpin-helix domain-containing protein [Rubrivivax sp.]|nr:helix-hairpin-helix domain-containing protein [Rubrivivax sp.]
MRGIAAMSWALAAALAPAPVPAQSPAQSPAMFPAMSPAAVGFAGAAAAAASRAAPSARGVAPTPAAPAPLDINSAPAARLATLPGVGPAEAARIVAHRPYLSKAELVTRQVVPEGVFLGIKDRIVAVQKSGNPQAAAAARRASAP